MNDSNTIAPMGSAISMPNQLQAQTEQWSTIREVALPAQQVDVSRTKQVVLIAIIAVSALVFVSGVVATIQSQREKAHFQKLQRESRIIVL